MGERGLQVELWNFGAFCKSGNGTHAGVPGRTAAGGNACRDVRLCEWTLNDPPRPPAPLRAAFDDMAAKEFSSGTVMSPA